jgi:hypothetical protein
MARLMPSAIAAKRRTGRGATPQEPVFKPFDGAIELE